MTECWSSRLSCITCTFNDRQGPDNLDRVVDKWNEWADRNAVDDYAAWTLTPYYFGPQQEFDVIWMGAGKSAVALGRDRTCIWRKTTGFREDFEDVLDCDGHSNFASVNYKAPPEGATPATSVLTFSDCKYKEGATFSAVSAAMAQWSQHLSDEGSVTESGTGTQPMAVAVKSSTLNGCKPTKILPTSAPTTTDTDWRRLPNQGQVAQSLD